MDLVRRLFATWTGFVFLFFYLPIAVLVLFSFNESRLNIVWTGFTFDWYLKLFDDRTLVRTLKNSLIVASFTTAISVVLGTAGSWLLYRYRYRASSLLETLDATRTSMGSRLLGRWLGRPLLDVEAIRARHDCVAVFHADGLRRGDVRERLREMPDAERIVGRVTAGVALPPNCSTRPS